MSAEPITAEALIAAFALPAGPPPRRVPKSSLADNVPTTVDRRLIDRKLARLEWISALNTAATGIAEGSSDGLRINTVNLLFARTRGAMPPRLAEIIHRVIPQPVVLIHAEDAPQTPAAISLATKRPAERDPGRVVLTRIQDSGPLYGTASMFLESLSLARLPAHNLATLYMGLVDRTDALAAAQNGERFFRLASSGDEQQNWRDALAAHAQIQAEIGALATAMRRESRLAARVELGERVRRLQAALDKCRVRLK